jgi:hypothetical protein
VTPQIKTQGSDANVGETRCESREERALLAGHAATMNEDHGLARSRIRAHQGPGQVQTIAAADRDVLVRYRQALLQTWVGFIVPWCGANSTSGAYGGSSRNGPGTAMRTGAAAPGSGRRRRAAAQRRTVRIG